MSSAQPFNVCTFPLQGVALLEASAGTGKTWSIEHLVLRFLLEPQAWSCLPAGSSGVLPPEGLLVVTFTRNAAAELRARIRTRLDAAIELADHLERTLVACESEAKSTASVVAEWCAARGEEGLRQLFNLWLEDRSVPAIRLALHGTGTNLDQACIATIHSFCQRLLESFGVDAPGRLNSELSEDESWKEEVQVDLWRQFVAQMDEARWYLFSGSELCKNFRAVVELLLTRDPVKDILKTHCYPHKLQPLLAWMNELRWEKESLAEAWRATGEAMCSALASGAYDLRSGYDVVAKVATLDQYFLSPDLWPVHPSTNWIGSSKWLMYATTGKNKPIAGTGDFLFTTAMDAFSEKMDTVRWQELQHLLAGDLVTAMAGRIDEIKKGRRQKGLMGFDELLEQIRDLLRGDISGELAAEVRKRFPVAIVDEFQDTDPLQYELFRTVYTAGNSGERPSGCALVMVGDSKQSIYRFRNADVYSYLDARDDADQVRQLSVNHRSDKALVTAINQLYCGQLVRVGGDCEWQPDGAFGPGGKVRYDTVSSPDGKRSHALRTKGSGAVLESIRLVNCPPRHNCFPEAEYFRKDAHWFGLAAGAARSRMAFAVALEVFRYLRDNEIYRSSAQSWQPLQPSDFAILVSSHNDAATLQEALALRGIAATRRGPDSIFATTEALELYWLLRAALQPVSTTAVRTALAARGCGFSVDELGVLSDSDVGHGGEGSIAHWRKRFERMAENWRRSGVLAATHELFYEGRDGVGYYERLLHLPLGLRMVANYRHILDLLQDQAVRAHLRPDGLLRWFGSCIINPANRPAGDQSVMRLDDDGDAVTLMTMHAAKGLEFNIVLLPTLARSRRPVAVPQRLHGLDGGKELWIDHLDDTAQSQAKLENYADDLRRQYVALTRARHHVWILWGGQKQGKEGTATPSPLADLIRGSFLSNGPWTPVNEHSQAGSDLVKTAWWPAEQKNEEGARYNASSAVAADNALDVTQWHGAPYLPYDVLTSYSGLHREEQDRHHESFHTTRAAIVDKGSQDCRFRYLTASAATGSYLHKLMEVIDFESPCSDLVAATWFDKFTPATVQRNRRDSTDLYQLIAGDIQSLLHTVLPCGFCLANVPRSHRWDELEFHLPFRSGDKGGFSVQRLGSLLCTGGWPIDSRSTPVDWRNYGEALLQRGHPRGAESVQGYLNGFIDLLMIDPAGKEWYIVDYKSNQLTEYSAAILASVMAQNDYLLQYLLYAVAGGRLISQIAGNGLSFGGVLYPFLRGVQPGLGVYFDALPKELLEQLNTLFAGHRGQS